MGKRNLPTQKIPEADRQPKKRVADPRARNLPKEEKRMELMQYILKEARNDGPRSPARVFFRAPWWSHEAPQPTASPITRAGDPQFQSREWATASPAEALNDPIGAPKSPHSRPSASRCPGMPRGRRGGPTPGFEGASAATRPRPPCPAGQKNGLRPGPLRVTVWSGRPAGGCHVFFGPRRIERAALRKRATRSDLATQNFRFLRFIFIEGICKLFLR